jgi:hypothetical protein
VALMPQTCDPRPEVRGGVSHPASKDEDRAPLFR